MEHMFPGPQVGVAEGGPAAPSGRQGPLSMPRGIHCAPPPSQVSVGCVLESIKTYKAEVLLVLPDSLYLWGVQNSLIIGHALLCIFLVLFLKTDFKK